MSKRPQKEFLLGFDFDAPEASPIGAPLGSAIRPPREPEPEPEPEPIEEPQPIEEPLLVIPPLAMAPPSLPTAVEPEPEAEEPSAGQGLLGDMFTPYELEQMRAARFFTRVDEDLATDYRCPVCTYEWSGNPKPRIEDQEADLAT